MKLLELISKGSEYKVHIKSWLLSNILTVSIGFRNPLFLSTPKAMKCLGINKKTIRLGI